MYLVPGASGLGGRGVSGRGSGPGGWHLPPPNFFFSFLFFHFFFDFFGDPPPPPKQTQAYGQRAAGTHPTGMHYCSA